MPNTTYFSWTYPDETVDPYFDNISDFFIEQDNSVFGLLNTACNIIIPPSTVNWNPISLTLSWNDDFQVPLLSSGFILSVQYGPSGNRSATFLDGSRLIVTVPTTSTGSIIGNFSVTNGAVTATDGLFTVGFCRGTKFYANFPQVFT